MKNKDLTISFYKRLLFCGVFLLSLISYSQDDTCKNNLAAELSCETVFSYSTDQTDLDNFDPVVINVKFWEIFDDNGNIPNDASDQTVFPDGLEKEALDQIARLNIFFNHANIYFKYIGVGSINSNDLLYDFETATSLAREIEEINYDDSNPFNFIGDTNAYNIFISPNVAGGASPAYRPLHVESRASIRFNDRTKHEVGHTFGINHTDLSWYGENPYFLSNDCEHVTRDETNPLYNATTHGDRVVDTPAMPEFRLEDYWDKFFALMDTGNYTLGQAYAEAEATYIPFRYYNNCNYTRFNATDCLGVEQYQITQYDLSNFMASGHGTCSTNVITTGQSIRLRESILATCSDNELQTAINTSQNFGLESLYQPYDGEYYFAGPYLPIHTPLFQPGFDYEFISCDCECPQPSAYNESFTTVPFSQPIFISKNETDYGTITHPNHRAIRIVQLNDAGTNPQHCYDNNNRAPSGGRVMRFNDGVPNANVTITQQDSTQINNPQLINNLQPGLYNIEKDYQDGSIEQNMVLKQGNN